MFPPVEETSSDLVTARLTALRHCLIIWEMVIYFVATHDEVTPHGKVKWKYNDVANVVSEPSPGVHSTRSSTENSNEHLNGKLLLFLFSGKSVIENSSMIVTYNSFLYENKPSGLNGRGLLRE